MLFLSSSSFLVGLRCGTHFISHIIVLLRHRWHIACAVDVACAGLPARAVLIAMCALQNTTNTITCMPTNCVFAFALTVDRFALPSYVFRLLYCSLAGRRHEAGREHRLRFVGHWVHCCHHFRWRYPVEMGCCSWVTFFPGLIRGTSFTG